MISVILVKPEDKPRAIAQAAALAKLGLLVCPVSDPVLAVKLQRLQLPPSEW